MSARNWVDKLKGLLQREEGAESAPVSATESAPEAAPTQEVLQPILEEPATPIPAQVTAPPPAKPRAPRQLRKIMPGTPKEQIDWSLRQVATVGDQLNAILKSNSTQNLSPLERDKVLLKVGYGVVTLALKTKPTEASLETLRSLRTALKNALLSALRKGFHKHAPEATALGATMVDQVDAELTAIDKEVQIAMARVLSGEPAPCETLRPFLKPLVGDDAKLAEKIYAELDNQFGKVFAALPIQDLLL